MNSGKSGKAVEDEMILDAKICAPSFNDDAIPCNNCGTYEGYDQNVACAWDSNVARRMWTNKEEVQVHNRAHFVCP